jgi:hypothetical protein
MWGYGSSPLELLACQAMVQGLVYLDEFSYSTFWEAGTSSELTAGTDKTQRIQINSDSDFIAQRYNLFANGATLDEILGLPDYLITITRAGSGRDVMNNPIKTQNFCGNFFNGMGSSALGNSANFPGYLPITSLYQGNSTVSIRLQNTTSLTPARVEFVMSGFKVFYQTNRQGQVGNRQDIFHAL